MGSTDTPLGAIGPRWALIGPVLAWQGQAWPGLAPGLARLLARHDNTSGKTREQITANIVNMLWESGWC